MEAVASLVRAAADGDQQAWDALVERFNGLVWSVARGYRLSTTDAADVVQTAWLRLVERLDTIRDPERVGAWLATTTRREALRVIRGAGRQVPTDEEWRLEPREPDDPPPETGLLEAERDAVLWASVQALSEPCQRLLRVLMAGPPPSYEEVAAALDMPIGSIGPTRGRCLERLRQVVVRSGITTEAGDSP